MRNTALHQKHHYGKWFSNPRDMAYGSTSIETNAELRIVACAISIRTLPTQDTEGQLRSTRKEALYFCELRGANEPLLPNHLLWVMH